MAKETIAVDVDDVLAAHAQEFVNSSNSQYGTNLTIEDYHNRWSEIWNVDRDETRRRAKAFHLGGSIVNFAVITGADEALIKLKQSYDLVVVTARREELVGITGEWLDRHYGELFSDVRYVPVWQDEGSVTKAEVCREIGASHLIDDYVEHCELAAASGINSLLFGNYAWNRHQDISPGITRVADWQEVLEYFDGQ